VGREPVSRWWKQEKWGPKELEPKDDADHQKTEGKKPSTDIPESSQLAGKSQSVIYENCGLSNHTAIECRRLLCEICGFNNHSTYDCKRCLPWNYGPKLCATQVEEQSFFYIEECIDPRVALEKASTAIITVISGSINAKQIEYEFLNLIGGDAWRWRARPMANNKFLLRFPTAKMASEWSRIKHLTMRNEAQIMIETWSPSVGAKGML
jgi:hypothetical protein